MRAPLLRVSNPIYGEGFLAWILEPHHMMLHGGGGEDGAMHARL